MFESVGSALFLLIRVALIYTIYSGARKLACESSCAKIKAYAWAIGVSAVLALFSTVNLGQHREGGDPLTGGGEIVVDYVPTKKQKEHQAITAFTILAVASLVGTSKGLKERDSISS